MTSIPESTRIRNLRNLIIREIPRIPNNRQSLQRLEAMPLTDLFITYANWVSRLIRPCIRTIKTSQEVKEDERWESLSDKILPFLAKVEKGEDLKPNLSKKVFREGFSLSSLEPHLNNLWGDKDMILNVTEYHHFHLGENMMDENFVERTDNVLFAKVTRDEFEVLGIFDHNVFKMSREPVIPMSNERKRLLKFFDNHPPHSRIPGITLSGHALRNTIDMQKYVRVIKEIDPKLDNKAYIQELFVASGITVPQKTKLIWDINCLDLRVHDKRSGAYFLFCKGPN